VDNVTHTLIGLSLAKAGVGERTALAVPALLIGANLPDIEIVWQLGRGSYLDSHRGISHTPLGVIGLSLCLAGALWLYPRYRRRDFPRPPALLSLWGLSLAGMATHPFFDLLNDYGIRLLLPFRSAWYYGDLLTILDPWIWLILGCGLVPLARSNRSRGVWGALGVLALLILMLGWHRVTVLLWIAAAAVSLAIGRWLRDRGLNPARFALLALVLYLGALGIARRTVLSNARASGPGLVSGRLERIDVIPGRPQSLLRWTVILQTHDRYYIGDSGLGDWQRHEPGFEAVQKNLEDPHYRASLANPDMAALARFARFPVVTVEPAAEGNAVVLRDLRYSRNRTGGFGAVRVVVPFP